MTHLYMPVFSLSLLLTGLSAGVIGLLGNNGTLWRAGLFIVLTSVPLLVIRTVHNSLSVSAGQLADADNAGYRRALEHVARGLLDVPNGPPPGARDDGDNRADLAAGHCDQAAGNVITLRPRYHHQLERKAQ